MHVSIYMYVCVCVYVLGRTIARGETGTCSSRAAPPRPRPSPCNHAITQHHHILALLPAAIQSLSTTNYHTQLQALENETGMGTYTHSHSDMRTDACIHTPRHSLTHSLTHSHSLHLLALVEVSFMVVTPARHCTRPRTVTPSASIRSRVGCGAVCGGGVCGGGV